MTLQKYYIYSIYKNFGEKILITLKFLYVIEKIIFGYIYMLF